MNQSASTSPTARRRSFWRAVSLAGLVVLLSPLSSSLLGPATLVLLPTALFLIAFQRRRRASVLLALGLSALAAIGVGGAQDLWYVERGWAVLVGGGFVATTAVLPDRPLFERATLAVILAISAVVGLGLLRSDLLVGLDWRIAGLFDSTLSQFDLAGRRGASLVEAMRTISDVAKRIYPALLVLASLAALGCTSYIAGRMAGEEAPLGPMRQFRFSDHLAWLLVLGLALLVLPVGVWAARTGGNVVAVMGGLYVLRGAAVLVWLGTSVVSSTWSIALWTVAALLFYPVTLGTAFVMGLSDTWLDLRRRLRVETERE